MAMLHPNLIKQVVVLNSWMWSSTADPDFIKLRRILKSPLLPFLYLYLNFSPRFILPKSFGDHKLSGKLLKQYTRPFQNRFQRHGALAFARSLLHDQSWFESLWEQRQTLAHLPFLFIWGMKDPVIKPHYLDQFMNGFPKASAIQLKACGHFPQEEEPLRVAEGIRQFIASEK
jgi:haloalkane dehalogenase